jgi:hypothetical protein
VHRALPEKVTDLLAETKWFHMVPSSDMVAQGFYVLAGNYRAASQGQVLDHFIISLSLEAA